MNEKGSSCSNSESEAIVEPILEPVYACIDQRNSKTYELIVPLRSRVFWACRQALSLDCPVTFQSVAGDSFIRS